MYNVTRQHCVVTFLCLIPQARDLQLISTNNTVCSKHELTAEPSRQSFNLTIATADEVPAAEAVIAGLHGVQDAFSHLDHVQLLQAFVIANVISAEDITNQVSMLLKAATASKQGLSIAALHKLAGMRSWPVCLLQLLPVILSHASCLQENTVDVAALLNTDISAVLQRILLQVFGDLHAVWSDAVLTIMLLRLPYSAMQLLLSSDQLQVPSEDIVLYTAQRYLDAQEQEDEYVRARVQSALAELVRAPHLSDVMLHRAVLCTDSSKLLMGGYLTQLAHLLPLKLESTARGTCRAPKAVAGIKGIPAGWLLGQRQLVPATAGTVDWTLSVQQLKAACKEAYATQTPFRWRCPGWSAPVSGFAWALALDCRVDAGGVVISVEIEPYNTHSDFIFDLSFDIICNGRSVSSSIADFDTGRWYDLLGSARSGRLPGGWDEDIWAAMGLSAAGVIDLDLAMRAVS